ncbi:uncharacterized protein LOC114420560 [Glycine soja]|nr:uncharacterized protein LOC114420560 [Glycine soja]
MRKYPRLYQVSCQQQRLIQQAGRQTKTVWEWNLEWRRPLFDNEVDAAVRFMDDISQIQIQNQITDCWIWKPETTGQYSTKSAYYLLQEATVGDTLDEALEDLWKLKIPAKAQIFAWRLIKDRLPTKANMRRRQIQMNDIICPFCRSKEEEASHLFFYCPKTQPLWWESLSWIQTNGVFSISPRQHFMQQTIGTNGGKQYSRWKCCVGGYVGSSEDNVGFPAVWEVLWVRATTMWVSRERFPEDFRREEKEKSDFRQEDDKEKREGKVSELAICCS